MPRRSRLVAAPEHSVLPSDEIGELHSPLALLRQFPNSTARTEVDSPAPIREGRVALGDSPASRSPSCRQAAIGQSLNAHDRVVYRCV